MANTYWLKQTKDKPLFEDLLWSRPENKRHAGKLLIVGGNLHGFATPGNAYGAAMKARAGTVRVLLPDKLQKTVGKLIPEAEFAPSTPSGSFARTGLAQLLEAAAWADGVLLAGDLGHNSETAILLDAFVDKCEGRVTLADDSLDYFLGKDSPLISRPGTTSVIELAQLQKLVKNNRPNLPILHTMTLVNLVEMLHELSTGNPGQIITWHAGNFIVASGGQVSTTPGAEKPNWQIELASFVSVWQLQNPKLQFEAPTTAAFEYSK